MSGDERMPFDLWRPHPWHGLSAGDDPPRRVHAFVEITPFDTVKYEIDKTTGYLRVDRPQYTSSLPPTLYGFIPRTRCGPRAAALTPGAERGCGDPLDVCVLGERPITRAELVLDVLVVGGITMVDDGAAETRSSRCSRATRCGPTRGTSATSPTRSSPGCATSSPRTRPCRARRGG